MKKSILELQTLEFILNMKYKKTFNSPKSPIYLLLNLNNQIIKTQLNNYSELDSIYPLIYTCIGGEIFEQGIYNNLTVDFKNSLDKVYKSRISKEVFKHLDILLELIQNLISDNNLIFPETIKAKSLKKVTLIQSGVKLPFLNINQKTFELVGLYLDEETETLH